MLLPGLETTLYQNEYGWVSLERVNFRRASRFLNSMRYSALFETPALNLWYNSSQGATFHYSAPLDDENEES